MTLIILYDFIQVLLCKRRHYTKNDYLSKQIQFSTISLLEKVRWNHNSYSKQKLNMTYFTQANEYDMNMHAKIQSMNMHWFL
jgi:hypothetical protein